MRILLNLDLEDSDLPGMLHGVIPRMPSPLTLRIRKTELLVVVPARSNGKGWYYWCACVSPAQCPAWLRFVLSLDPWEGRVPACSEPQLSLNDQLASLLTTISHRIWHLMRSTDENGSTCAKCEGEHRSACRGVKNNNNLVFTFLFFFYSIFNIKQIFTNQNLINFS